MADLRFFLAEPLIVFQAGNAGADGLSLVLTLWFLFCADKLIRTAVGWWCIAQRTFLLRKSPHAELGSSVRAVERRALPWHRPSARQPVLQAALGQGYGDRRQESK